ncbi:hypothetical protein [Geobacillus stearothermophilus]|nr:hypothetical protein [Geobacillus stearothermophilus]RLP95995.1 hypothetical protein D9545_15925 [Geobacillus stearothermophilus]
MVLRKSVLINIIFFLCLFPYIKYVPFLDVEVQPIAVVFSVFYFFFFVKGIKDRSLLFYLIAVLTYFIVSLLLSMYEERYETFYVIQSFLILITPLFIFMSLKNNINLISTKLFVFSVLSWAILGTFQMFLPSVLSATGIELILSNIISRWTSTANSVVERGVVMFSSEPSYAGHVILLMFIFTIYLYRNSKISKKLFIFLMCLNIWMVFLNQSGTLVISMVLFVLSWVFFNIRKPVYWFLLIPIIFTSIITFLIVKAFDVRSLNMLITLITLFLDGSIGINELLSFSQQYDSDRLPATVAGYYNIVLSNGIGTGLGSWSYRFIESMSALHLANPENAKPFAYAALVAFDMGLIGLIPFVIFISNVILKNKVKKFTGFEFGCLVIALLGIFIQSMTSLPIYWIILLFSFKDVVNLKSQLNKAA